MYNRSPPVQCRSGINMYNRDYFGWIALDMLDAVFKVTCIYNLRDCRK